MIKIKSIDNENGDKFVSLIIEVSHNNGVTTVDQKLRLDRDDLGIWSTLLEFDDLKEPLENSMKLGDWLMRLGEEVLCNQKFFLELKQLLEPYKGNKDALYTCKTCSIIFKDGEGDLSCGECNECIKKATATIEPIVNLEKLPPFETPIWIYPHCPKCIETAELPSVHLNKCESCERTYERDKDSNVVLCPECLSNEIHPECTKLISLNEPPPFDILIYLYLSNGEKVNGYAKKVSEGDQLVWSFYHKDERIGPGHLKGWLPIKDEPIPIGEDQPNVEDVCEGCGEPLKAGRIHLCINCASMPCNDCDDSDFSHRAYGKKLICLDCFEKETAEEEEYICEACGKPRDADKFLCGRCYIKDCEKCGSSHANRAGKNKELLCSDCFRK